MNVHIRIAEAITDLMDNRFTFLGFRFGLDPIIGLIPGIGDLVPVFLSLYMVWIASHLKLPRKMISKMISNIVFDFVLGLIPLVGDASDFVFKANTRNLAILKEHLRGPVEEGTIVG